MTQTLENNELGQWFLLIANKEGSWNVEGPYDPGEARHKFERHQVVMPNCPCKVVQFKVYSEFDPLILVA